MTKLLLEIPITAGIESKAKTISIAANKTTTTNKLVYKGLLLWSLMINLPSPSVLQMGKNFFKNKRYYYVIFFLYGFCWNIKTVISDRVGSFPIYRIITKSTKILLNLFTN